MAKLERNDSIIFRLLNESHESDDEAEELILFTAILYTFQITDFNDVSKTMSSCPISIVFPPVASQAMKMKKMLHYLL